MAHLTRSPRACLRPAVVPRVGGVPRARLRPAVVLRVGGVPRADGPPCVAGVRRVGERRG